MKRTCCSAAMGIMLLVGANTVARDVDRYEIDPQAIAILEKADDAIRKIRGLRYRAHYVGAYTSRGRAMSKVLLRRERGNDAVMGTIGYSAKVEVTAIDAPFAQEHYPSGYTLIDGPTRALLIDPAARTIQRAEGQDRMSLNYGAFTNAVLPQYLRPEPLSVELENSIAAQYLGIMPAGGVESHVVWLKFEATSGLGEQLLYFGVEDHLIRKATLVMPRTLLPPPEGAPDDAPQAFNPTMLMEITLVDLEVLPAVPDSSFEIAHQGFRVIDATEKPSVGFKGPSWALPLPGGGTVDSDALRGKVAVLFFWASWCSTCHTSLPQIQKIHDRFPEDVQVLAINAFDRDDAMAYIRDHGYSFDVALAGDDLLANQFRFVGQPALVVLDRKGVIRYRKVGPPDEAAWTIIETLAARE